MHDQARHGAASVFLSLVAILSVPYGSAFAETLELNDGTVIHGEIKSLQEDVYTVETSTLGTVRVPKQNVRTIDYASGETQRSPVRDSAASRAEIGSMQLRMIQTPNLLAMLLSLQNDAEVQSVLADPEVMSALASGDYAALMNHPKIIALTRNSKVREVITEVQ